MAYSRSFMSSLKQSNINGAIIIALTAVFTAISSVSAQVQLIDRTTEAGLTVIHNPHDGMILSQMQWMTGGMAVGDFNNDGHQDLYWICGGGDPDKLFINDGNGSFVDQALAWGID